MINTDEGLLDKAIAPAVAAGISKVIKHRASVGGPQPAEMVRMLKAANQSLTLQGDWIKAKRARISSSLDKLDSDFGKIAPAQ